MAYVSMPAGDRARRGANELVYYKVGVVDWSFVLPHEVALARPAALERLAILQRLAVQKHVAVLQYSAELKHLAVEKRAAVQETRGTAVAPGRDELPVGTESTW